MTNSDPLRRYVFVNKTLTRETTKVEFFRDEQAALEPFQPGLFDDLIGG